MTRQIKQNHLSRWIKVAHTLGLRHAFTKEVSYAVATRLVQACGLGVGLLLATQRLSPLEQGVFFVFLSYASLIQLADGGTSYAAVQVAARLSARGDHATLAAMTRQAQRVNFLFVAFGALFTATVGAWSLMHGASSTSWQGPWAGLVISVACAQLVQLKTALLEGARSYVNAWQLRLAQETVGAITLTCLLLSDAGLWSVAGYWLSRATTGILILRYLNTRAAARLDDAEAKADFNWWKQVWPFQWRIGISALCGFLIFQSFSPILLVMRGAEDAGRFGLAISVMNMLLALTSAWPLSQAAPYARLLAHERYVTLKDRVSLVMRQSTLLAAGLALIGSIFLLTLPTYLPQLAARLTDPTTTIILLLTAVLHHATFVLSVPLRAQGREPLLAVTFWGSIVGALGTCWVARYDPLFWVAVSHATMTFLGLLVTLALWRRLLSQPHLSEVPPPCVHPLKLP